MSQRTAILDARSSHASEIDHLLEKRLRAGARRAAAAPGIPRRSGNRPAPLSFAQQRLWFLDQLEPGTPLYNVPHALRLSGPLDLKSLEQAFTEIVQRHEALRTTINVVDGIPLQQVSVARPFRLTIIDLQSRVGGELEQELSWRLKAEAQRPFDLRRDMMLRATVFRLAALEHVLLVTMHHIASDAWSIALLSNGLAALYNAYLKGQKSPLPELPIQYADFAAWQRDSGPDLDRHLEYWRQALAGAPGSLELPTDYPNALAAGYRGATRSMMLPRGLLTDLQKLSHREGATLFMTLLVAFKILLHRYSGEIDLVVGSPVAGRSRLETEPLIGFFLNTLVFRTDLGGDPTVLEALARVRDVSLSAFAHQDVPFEKLVQDLQPDRYSHRNPFFQVMFTFQSNPVSAARFDRLHVESLEVDAEVSPFDLTLFTEETDQGLAAAIEYKTDLFQAGTIDRMLESFRVLLEGMVANPQRRLSEAPLLSAAQQHQILIEWNQTTEEAAASKCIHELIAEQAARTPDAPAVIFGQRQLTYGQLNSRAGELARRLQALGVGPEVLVGICMERSTEMLIGLLAILKAGGAYVPLDPSEPRDRLAFKLADAAVPVLLTQHRLLQSLPGAESKANPSGKRSVVSSAAPAIICVDSDGPLPAEKASAASQPETLPTPQNLAYAIYTSGSTGTPKGVLVEHRAVVHHSSGFARRFALNANDRVLQFAPLSFDVSAEEIFPALITGATLVLRPDFLSASVKDFQLFLSREKVTVLNLPTSYWNEWMKEMERSGQPPPPSVRLVIVGSETVTIDQFQLWQRLMGHRVRWCNAYGVTEATVTSTIYEPRPEEQLRRSVPIGRPVAGARAHILDAAGQPVPIGVRGELYLAGVKTARGYLNRPEPMAQKFLPDPFSGEPGARMLRSGDLACWRPDGNIEFLGRADDQVKIRGFRIELGEVESLLLQHPQVRQAVVLAREDSPGERRLVAYVVGRGKETHLKRKVRDFLKAKVPAYMIPSAIVELDELPLLPNGKVDRKALPTPDPARPEMESTFTPASDPLEEQLVALWGEVLNLEAVGIHDNFFDLGGHSLLAIKLCAEVEKLTGRHLPVFLLFQSPTIAELAQAIRRQDFSSVESSLLPIQPSGNRPPLYLVHGAGGGMLWGYANLAKYLPHDQPVYALNSRGMNGLEEFTTVEEIAAAYVKELLQFQPEMPFQLGGYCFGGEVAFEMAQQLASKGRKVARLVLFNAMPPNSGFERFRLGPTCLLRFTWNTLLWLNYFRQWAPEQRRAFFRRKAGLIRKGLRLRLGQGRQVAEIDAADWVDVTEYPEYQRRLWSVHLQASARYIPRPYAGHITVFRTRIHPFLCSFDPAFGWRGLAAGGVAVKIMPGAHESVLDEPHVRAVARELSKCLAGADEGET